jgi:hypothetical protein
MNHIRMQLDREKLKENAWVIILESIIYLTGFVVICRWFIP